jgi:hypothetical protein
VVKVTLRSKSKRALKFSKNNTSWDWRFLLDFLSRGFEQSDRQKENIKKIIKNVFPLWSLHWKKFRYKFSFPAGRSNFPKVRFASSPTKSLTLFLFLCHQATRPLNVRLFFLSTYFRQIACRRALGTPWYGNNGQHVHLKLLFSNNNPPHNDPLQRTVPARVRIYAPFLSHFLQKEN